MGEQHVGRQRIRPFNANKRAVLCGGGGGVLAASPGPFLVLPLSPPVTFDLPTRLRRTWEVNEPSDDLGVTSRGPPVSIQLASR